MPTEISFVNDDQCHHHHTVPSTDIQRKEILFNGFFYDVTDFINKHPGGQLIQFYTEEGEDATQAIEQFHFRSKTKVERMMNSLRKRPAVSPEELNPDRKAQTRHELMTKDFKELFENLLAEGYFQPSIRHVLLRLLECVSLYVLWIGLSLHQTQPFYTKILVAVFGGFMMGRVGWFEHEGGHRSLTGNRKIDDFLQTLATCSVIGFSSVWWNSQHNRHHAMPNRLHHDVDIASLPVVVFNEKAVSNKSQISTFFVLNQGFLYWTLSMFIAFVSMKFYIHPRCQLRKGAYFEMFLNLGTYVVIYEVGVFWYFLTAYFFMLFMLVNFGLSHSHLEVTEKPTHWIEYAFTHTANIKPSMLCDWWMGYLNYQIEHHLFPTMPQFRQQEICGRVQALAEKHGLPYVVYEYTEALRLSGKNLFDVARRLEEKNWN